jgi:antitoxin MazE
MKATLIKIGNSRGIRLPKPVIEQFGFKDEVELAIHQNELVIRPANTARAGCHEAFARMHESGDDTLLDSDKQTEPSWDEEEWEW